MPKTKEPKEPKEPKPKEEPERKAGEEKTRKVRKQKRDDGAIPQEGLSGSMSSFSSSDSLESGDNAAGSGESTGSGEAVSAGLRKVISMEKKEFAKFVEEAKFSSLVRLRKALLGLDDEKKKAKVVEKRLREQIDEGYTVKRRKPGSGERVEETRVYKDSAQNRELDRVGREYKVVMYRDPEYIEVAPRLPKKPRRRSVENPKKNCWLESVAEAKVQIGAPKWVVIRKDVKNPEDPSEVMGHRLYTKAMEILQTKRQQQQQQQQQAVVPVAV